MTVTVVRNGVVARPTPFPRGPLLLPAGAVTGRWAKPAAPAAARKHPTICSTTVGERQPAAEATLPGAQEDAPVAPFDWDKCWYPVAVLHDLEPKKPTPVKLLGREFVLWRDVNKEWKCFQDVCPHRLAPLSEGRIEPSDGSLMCSYHGWRFQSDGECTRIPQAIDGGAASGCKNPRSRAKAFPVKVERKMVWVWPDGSPSAFLDSAMNRPNGYEFFEDGLELRLPTYTRELPYPYDALIENVIDPAHVPFAHHGSAFKREDSKWYEGEKDESSTEMKMKFPFARRIENEKTKSTEKFVVTFDAPNLITYTPGFPGKHMLIFAIPETSTSCKVFLQYPSPKTEKSLFAKIRDVITMRNVLLHLFHHWVFDGDMVFLNGQSRKLRQLEEEGKTWDSQYFMPSSCDIGVVAFRRWLEGKVGGGGPKLPNGDPLLQNNFGEDNRKVLLDRYHTHTKHCRICMNGLKNVAVVKNCALAACVGFAAYALTVALALIRGTGSSIWSIAGSLVGIFLSSFISMKMLKAEQSFIFEDYEHWKT